MRKLFVFNQVTRDGYFVGMNGDNNWAHKQDPEWTAFVADSAKGGGVLLFGRITCELIASCWPTPLAAKNDPVLAMFDGVKEKLPLKLTKTRTFGNGNVLLCHEPMA